MWRKLMSRMAQLACLKMFNHLHNKRPATVVPRESVFSYLPFLDACTYPNEYHDHALWTRRALATIFSAI